MTIDSCQKLLKQKIRDNFQTLAGRKNEKYQHLRAVQKFTKIRIKIDIWQQFWLGQKWHLILVTKKYEATQF